MAPLIRWACLACCLALLGCAAGRQELRSRGMYEANSTAAALASASAPKRVAVVVGVDGYADPAFEDLLHAGADAEALGEALRAPTVGGFERVEVLVGPDATSRDAILAALARGGRDLRAEDVFVLYFSGHGTVAPGPRDGLRPYLLAADSVPADLASSAIDVATVVRWFEALPTQRKALIVDACFNGRGKSSVDPELLDGLPEKLEAVSLSDAALLDAGEAHLFATSVGRPAFEDDEVGHGLYTHYLLQALSWARGDADLDADSVLTAWEAHDYARSRVVERTGGVQVPEAILRVVGESDLVLAGDPEARTERDMALVFDFSGQRGPFAGATLRIDGRARGELPGAVLVEPGRRHIEVVSAEGEVRLDGYARFRAGDSLGVAELKVAVREDRVLQHVRLGFAPQTGDLRRLWGPGYLTLELGGAWRRARGPVTGFVLGGFAGVGVAPSRDAAGELATKGRGLFWLGAETGWAGGRRRFRPRLTWQVRMTIVPRSLLGGGVGPDSEAGWLLLSTGPQVALGVALSRRLSLQVAGAAHGLAVELDGDPAPRFRVHGSVSAGLEVAL